MTPQNEDKLRERVERAAAAALEAKGEVSALDIFMGIGWLNPAHHRNWRTGRVVCLERVVQSNLKRVSASMRLFREWARQRGLTPGEVRHTRATSRGSVDLRFSVSGDADIERAYRTHYFLPGREKLREKLDRPAHPVVFSVLRDSRCAQCDTELLSGSMLFMDAERPLCLGCAGFGDLEYLPAGDAALTRRATKYSGRTAVVVRFSRSRGRYERQGILVEPAALAKAESDLLAD